ncbi:MAG: hypothetical protein QOJ85_3464, partial [Solirubrobacteraceae bacterium]|nr:hypothetical protein [Solirubrobacteraceae bacterium]
MPIGELMAEFHDRPHATPKPATAGPVFLGIRVYARVVADALETKRTPARFRWARVRDKMAEREGFEPSVDVEAHTRFPVVPVQPLRHLSSA